MYSSKTPGGKKKLTHLYVFFFETEYHILFCVLSYTPL